MPITITIRPGTNDMKLTGDIDAYLRIPANPSKQMELVDVDTGERQETTWVEAFYIGLSDGTMIGVTTASPADLRMTVEGAALLTFHADEGTIQSKVPSSGSMSRPTSRDWRSPRSRFALFRC